VKTLLRTACLVVVLGTVLAGCGIGKSVRYSPGEIGTFPDDVQEHIRAGELIIGMTQAQVRLSWGAPYAVRTLAGQNSAVREEWEYRSLMGVVRTYLYFDDGVLSRLVSTNPSLTDHTRPSSGRTGEPDGSGEVRAEPATAPIK